MLYIQAEKIFSSIDFIEVENRDEDFTLEPEKLKNSNFFEKIIFFRSEALNFTFATFFQLLFIFAVTRRAGCSHLNSKSNTVSGKI